MVAIIATIHPLHQSGIAVGTNRIIDSIDHGVIVDEGYNAGSGSRMG
jgi:hypothetical protein